MTDPQVTQADRDNARTIVDSIVANLHNQGVINGVPEGGTAVGYLALELARVRQQARLETQTLILARLSSSDAVTNDPKSQFVYDKCEQIVKDLEGYDGTNALKEMLKQAGDEAEREVTAYWQRVVSEGLYTKEGWSDGAIKDASK